MYSLGGDLRFSAFTSRLLVVDFSSSVLLVSIMSPSSVEITCCCFRGFFLGEAPGGKSLWGIERLLANNVRDGVTVFVVRGGTAGSQGWIHLRNWHLKWKVSIFSSLLPSPKEYSPGSFRLQYLCWIPLQCIYKGQWSRIFHWLVYHSHPFIPLKVKGLKASASIRFIFELFGPMLRTLASKAG